MADPILVAAVTSSVWTFGYAIVHIVRNGFRRYSENVRECIKIRRENVEVLRENDRYEKEIVRLQALLDTAGKPYR
jgi:hypothetical protein